MSQDLKTEPVWKKPSTVASGHPSGQGPYDVCIVGAGIAGLSTAYQLTQKGQRVIVLDDGPVAGGQTGRTTAHLASAIDDRFTEVERIRGAEESRLAAESHAAAIGCIEETVRREGIACEFVRLDGYLFAHEPGQIDFLHQELEAARRAGLQVEMAPRAPWTAFDTGPCIRFARQGQFDPLAYLNGLVQAILRGGGTIRTGSHVKQIDDGTPARIRTADGLTLEAKAIVVATNTPINDLVTIHTKQFPYITYVVALRVPAGSVTKALYWDTLDPYHYVRLVFGPGQEVADTLLVGGEDHKTGQEADQEERFRRLEAWARERFPNAEAVTHRWSGQILETLDGLGFIGRNPGDEHIFIATGDSGMGMTHGTIAGMLLTDLILGRKNPWADLYEPSRKPLKALPQFVSENVNAAVQYTDWLTPGEVTSADEIRPGSGAIVRQGLRKLAVYRDEHGETHVCAAVCPHLKAIVAWNETEKTWDCPAHGSRFDCRGQVIQGPANSDLDPAELTSPPSGDPSREGDEEVSRVG